uniref:Pentatricopeptide repeat-containing protein n=1 Tax=Kalanchoe fedtschenkoi TaxID=63787 RepID=A0A7N0ZYG1_KALFE
MRAFFPVIKVSSNELKFIVGRGRVSRLFSVGNTALALSYSSDEEEKSVNKSQSVDDSLSGVFGSASSRMLKCNGIFLRGAKEYVVLKHKPGKLNRIASILVTCGWDLSGDLSVLLEGSDVVHVMNLLFWKSKDASLVLYFFRWSEDFKGYGHSIYSICTMIRILVSGNMNYRAVDLIAHVSRNFEGEELLENLFETHMDRSVLKTACSMLVKCYTRETRIEEAWKFVHQMKQFALFPSAAVYNLLLAQLLKLEETDIAWDLFEDVRQNIGLNASLFSLFIDYYCRKGSIGSAWKVLTDMRNLEILPDVVSFTSVIDSLCKMSRLKEATSILLKMVGMGLSLDSVVVSAVVDGYCKNGRSGEALKVMKYFKISLEIFTYTSFLSDLCKRGDMVEACQTFYDMMTSGLYPDCFCYTTLIAGYCNAGDTSSSLKYFGMMLKGGIKPSLVTYTSLISLFSKHGDTEMIEHILQVTTDEDLVLDLTSYNVLMNAYAKNGQLHKAFQLLDEMSSCKISPDIVTYNTIIEGLILRGFIEEAKALLDELPRRGLNPDVITFTSVVSGLSKNGNFEDAFLMWHCMSEHAIEPDVVTCSALLSGYCRQKRMDEAMFLFRRMLTSGLKPDLILFNTLIYGFCRVGDVDSAVLVVDMMVEYDTFPDEITLRALVLGYGHRMVADPLGMATLKLRRIWSGLR